MDEEPVVDHQDPRDPQDHEREARLGGDGEGPAQAPTLEPEIDRPHTGVGEVDAAVDDVAALDARPLEDHVEVFEDAHERLRRALDDTSDTHPA